MRITTSRLLLREFTPDDGIAMAAYQSDPRYLEYYGPEDVDFARSGALLAMLIEWGLERPRQNYQLAIVEPATSPHVIGSCGIRMRGRLEGSAEFGLEIAAHRWDNGLAGEAASAMFSLAFGELGLHELYGISVTENHRAARLVQRLGFEQVATRPGAEWMRAQGWSHTVWHLTHARWLAEHGTSSVVVGA